jgi:hypothetical protein
VNASRTSAAVHGIAADFEAAFAGAFFVDVLACRGFAAARPDVAAAGLPIFLALVLVPEDVLRVIFGMIRIY